MKKIYMVLVCCMLLLGGCGSSSNGGEIIDLTKDKLQEKIDKKDSFVLLVSRESCSHCHDLKEMLEETIQDHSTIIYKYEMDETNMDVLVKDAEWLQTTFVESDASESYSTPHIYYIYEANVRDSFNGYNESQPNQFWDFIKNNSLENSK